ncbi:TraR/DksA C4-type zinc finger protein [Pseudomonas leptonychotis]|uniref:TraR/DksA C4-type zinc finger protein n=1 Tax=Pseudomonas leptonychotis TaxID=2448482 RepID=UPI0038678664
MRKAESLQPLAECRECGERISEARQRAVKGVQCCVACQQIEEKRAEGYRA